MKAMTFTQVALGITSPHFLLRFGRYIKTSVHVYVYEFFFFFGWLLIRETLELKSDANESPT